MRRLLHTWSGRGGLRTVGKLMGHRVLQVTMRYAHLAPDHLKATVERLDFSMKAEEKQGGSAG